MNPSPTPFCARKHFTQNSNDLGMEWDKIESKIKICWKYVKEGREYHHRK